MCPRKRITPQPKGFVDKIDLTCSNCTNVNLQCIQERELRRSLRGLSKDTNRKSDFQKEIFPKKIKSELDGSIGYEVSPKQQYKTDTSNNRELLKMKDFPTVSPHDKTRERTKEKPDLTFSKSSDRTLQCVPEKELRRSPRALPRDSKLTPNFQKEIFQKNIQSEADDRSVYEVNPEKEKQINAFSNRKLLKIKDCWSPKTSPKYEFRLLRNGRNLQITSPSKSKNVQSLKDSDNLTGNIRFIKAANKRGSHQSACKNKASKLNIYQENSDKEIKTEEMYGALSRRKKLRSETTDDELWEGLTQKKRFKRFTPKKGISVVKTDDKHHESNKTEKDDVMADECKLLSNSIVPLSNHNEISTITPISIENSTPDISETDKDTQPRNEPLQIHLIGTSPPCNPTDSMNMFDGAILCIKDSCRPDTKKGRVRRNLSKELTKSPGVTIYHKNNRMNDDVSNCPKNDKIDDKIVELELSNSPGVSTNNINNKIHDQLVNCKTTTETVDTAVTESEANSDVLDKYVKNSSRLQEDFTEYAITDEQDEGVLELEQSDDNVSNQKNEQIPRNENVAKRSRRVCIGVDNYSMTDNNSPMFLYSDRNSDMAHLTKGIIKKNPHYDPHEQGCNAEVHAEYQPQNINVAINALPSSVNNNAKVAEDNDSSKPNTSFSFDSIGTDSGSYQPFTCFQDLECDERNKDNRHESYPLLENDSDLDANFQCGDDFCSISTENNMVGTNCNEMGELSPEVLNNDDNRTNQATYQISDRPETIVENVAFHRRAGDLTIPELIVENTKNATELVDHCNASDKETDHVAVDDELVGDECDKTLKVNTEKSITKARHPTQIVIVTPSKQSARLRDKRTITPSRKLRDYILYDQYEDSNSKYTSIKNKRRKIDYGIDSNFNSDNEITTSEENTCSMPTSSLPLKSYKNDDDFLNNNMSDIESGENVDEKSVVDDEIKSKLSNKPAIKLRMQKTQDGFLRIPTQPSQLQRVPCVSLSRIDNEQRECDDKSTGNYGKKSLQLQLPKANTSTVETYGHCESRKTKLENRDSETTKSFSRRRRRQRSPEEDIRIMPERSCRRKNESKEELLKNGTVGKHASILWLSENRRHFVQKHSHCPGAELDAIVTSAWRNLADKEKLPFYQRARNAMRDENKLPTYKSEKSANGTPSQSVSRKMQKFLCLSPTGQYNELKRWLALVHEVSPGEYAKLIANFKATMEKKKLQRQTGKSQGSSCDGESHHRRYLFQKILDIREKIMNIYHLKKDKQMEFIKEEFDATSKQLIAGEEVTFADGVVSQELEQVLSDLKSLENELKVAVSGTPLKSSSYENVLEDLKICEHVLSETSALPTNLLDILEDLPHADSKYAEDLPHAVSKYADDLPHANSKYADDLLQETLYCRQIGLDSQRFDSEFFNEEVQDTEAVDVALIEDNLNYLSDFFENEARLKISNSDPSGRTPPSQILTNWALADQFKSLAKEGIFIDSGSKMQIDQKHLLPFLRGKDIFNPSVPQRHATVHQGSPSTRKPRPSNSTKNNNATTRIPRVSKYDKYKRTISKRSMVVHYPRPFQPLNTSFYEHQLQLQLKPKLLQQKEHVSLNPTFNSLSNKPRTVSDKTKGRVTLQNEIEKRPIVSQESEFENNLSRISPNAEDEVQHNQASPVSEYPTRNAENNISPSVTGRNYSARTERLHQSSSLPSLREQKTDATTNDEKESTYPYTHSVIHRRIEHVQGRTVVRFTATAFDGRRTSSI